MEAPFDFAAFINSPAAAGENPRPWGDGRNAEGPVAAEAMQRSTSNTILDVFSTGAPQMQAMMSQPVHGVHGPAQQAFNIPHNGALLDDWNPRHVGTVGTHAQQAFQQPQVPLPMPITVRTGLVDGITVASETMLTPVSAHGVLPLPADYRARIAAHHSSQLRQWLPTLAETQANGVPAGHGGPGRSVLGMHSSPSVPLSQALRNPSVNAKPKRPELTIQERRRLSRRKSKDRDSSGSSTGAMASRKRTSKRSRNGSHNGDAHANGAHARVLSNHVANGHVSAAVDMDCDGIPDHSSHVFAGDFGPMVNSKRTNQMYSTSGFDLVGALARIATRPNPRITIGPVDFSCSFTVSDASQPDQPIIYCSDTFCLLTGYERQEILGRNCRFLQSPTGDVQAGSERVHTDGRAVRHMQKHTSALQECQTSLINYRKNGQPFINLVTIVPVSWGPDANGGAPALAGAAVAPVFLVGFQVDLVDNPGSIVERKLDGTYHVNYSHVNAPDGDAMIHDKENAEAAAAAAIAQDPAVIEANRKIMMAEELTKIIGSGSDETAQWAGMLLENSHDLIHVLSLKGTFLYVSPSVERLLGYKPEELVGRSISEFCHPSDVVPVFRELKDSTSNASIAAAARHSARTDPSVKPITKGGAGQSGPQVNLLMRMRHKTLGHAWIENVGKLHLEQGKGRKVVISSGRARPVYDLQWENARSTLGVTQPSFWSKVSLDGLFLSISGQVSEVLGHGADDSAMHGRHMRRIANKEAHAAVLTSLRSTGVSTVPHTMCDGAGGEQVAVLSTFYPSHASNGASRDQNTVFVHTQRRGPSTCSLRPNMSYPQDSVNAIVEAAAAASATGMDAHETGAVHKTGEPGVGSVFAELSTYRSSSWVFELHQLKNANKRLREEVRQRRRYDHGPLPPGGAVHLPTTVVHETPARKPSAGALHITPSKAVGAGMARTSSTLAGHDAVRRDSADSPSRSSSDAPATSSSDGGSDASLRATLHHTASGGSSDDTGATSLSDGPVPTVAGVKRARS